MGTLSRAHVSFRLYHDSLTPALVTDMLGLLPTEAYAKDEMGPPGPVTGRSHGWRTGMWLLDSPLPREAELDDHLQALLEQLGANAPLIQGFRAEGFSVDFSCGLFLDSDNEGLRIAPETLARVATLGAALDLDIYALFEDDEPATRAPDASL